MSLRLGDNAPDFSAETTEGQINLYDWMEDGWAILFSHPKDFTPVCTTELGQAAKLKSEFERLNVKLLALSVDTMEDHKGWAQDIEESQSCSVNFPIISDADRKIASMYDMVHPEEDELYTVRSVFVIGPDKKIKLMITYPMATGRDFNEILRVVESLQRTAEHKVATPANWRPGEEVIVVPTLSDEEAREMFPEGFRAEKPYLRYVKDPKDDRREDKQSHAA
jgi:alkyl hydroperoxide reductase subunit AhpC